MVEIDEYEFEEELTWSSLAERLEKMAQEIKKGEILELPMPSLKEGVIRLPLGEPIETGIEVKIRKSYTRVYVTMGWSTQHIKRDESE